jgi:hypothetical protein
LLGLVLVILIAQAYVIPNPHFPPPSLSPTKEPAMLPSPLPLPLPSNLTSLLHPEPKTLDFSYTHHGSIITLTPHTPEAEAWIIEHLPEDFNGAIEPRFFGNIFEALVSEGFLL